MQGSSTLPYSLYFGLKDGCTRYLAAKFSESAEICFVRSLMHSIGPSLPESFKYS